MSSNVYIRPLLSGLVFLLLAACADLPGLPRPSGESQVKIPTGTKAPTGDEAVLSPIDQQTFDRGVAALQSGNHAVAITEFKALSLSQPNLAVSHINLALAYRGQGDADAAGRAVNQALKLSPNSPEANLVRGVLHRESGEFASARDRYVKSLSANADYIDAHVNLGILCDLYLQDLACAQKHYRRAQELSPAEDRQLKGWLLELERRMK